MTLSCALVDNDLTIPTQDLVPATAMSMLSFGSHVIITGGTFTQVNNTLQERPQTPWDHLLAGVAPAAFHNSAERFDPPRCHPNTRVAVMEELRDFALRRSGAVSVDARILWLSGLAGAGKSAIAQTFCEECSSTNRLLASFFFNRSDPSRNRAKSFVATLTYQIYGKVPACHQSLILGAIESDPLVFERSVDAQFKALIMDPLQGLFGTDYFDKGAPSVIVVDGLDECSGAPVQVSILATLQNISKLPQSPFVFIVASRPEHDIQMFFRTSSLGRLRRQLNLDNAYSPDADIELFVREKIEETCATHPLKNSIPEGWPSSEAVERLVWKSSGQFIYASVVIKYVTSNRHFPPTRLDVVLRLRPPKRDLPFAELDAFYSHIFSCVEDIDMVLCILRIVLLFEASHIYISTKDIERLCDLDQGECHAALCDLQSVLLVQPTVCLLHKSLPDYLQDPARSHDYYVDTTLRAVIPILTQCLEYISDLMPDDNPGYLNFVLHHLPLLVSNIQLCHQELISFSLVNCRKTSNRTRSAEQESFLRDTLLWFAFDVLNVLCTVEGTDYEFVYYHHLHQFPELANQFSKLSGPSNMLLDTDRWIFPMIIIFILLGDADAHISPKVFEILKRLPSNNLSKVPLVSSPMAGLGNLCCSAARRCINSLMDDSSPKLAAFALELLPLILPDSRLSPDLNEACLPGRPFAYAAVGDHGLSASACSAYKAMREYMGRYAEAQLAL